MDDSFIDGFLKSSGSCRYGRPGKTLGRGKVYLLMRGGEEGWGLSWFDWWLVWLALFCVVVLFLVFCICFLDTLNVSWSPWMALTVLFWCCVLYFESCVMYINCRNRYRSIPRKITYLYIVETAEIFQLRVIVQRWELEFQILLAWLNHQLVCN